MDINLKDFGYDCSIYSINLIKNNLITFKELCITRNEKLELIPGFEFAIKQIDISLLSIEKQRNNETNNISHRIKDHK